MEPLRHRIVDRLVLRAVNRRQLVRSDFVEFEAADGGPEAVEEDPAAYGAEPLHAHADGGGDATPHHGGGDAVDHTCTATGARSAVRGVHLGDAGRAKFLGLFHATMTDPRDEAGSDDAGGDARHVPGRRLVAQVVESYERFLGEASRHGDGRATEDLQGSPHAAEFRPDSAPAGEACPIPRAVP